MQFPEAARQRANFLQSRVIYAKNFQSGRKGGQAAPEVAIGEREDTEGLGPPLGVLQIADRIIGEVNYAEALGPIYKETIINEAIAVSIQFL